MHTPSPSALAGVPLLLAAGVLWGTGGLLGSLLATATGLSPIAIAGYRLLTGGALLLAGLVVLRRRGPRGSAQWRRVGAVALLAAVFQASYFAAVALTSVALATLVTIGAAPVLVIVAERVAGRPSSVRSATACVLAVAGLALLVGLPGSAGAAPAGTALALLAAAGFATMTLLAARPVPGLDDTATTAVSFTIGGALLLAVAAPLTGAGFTPAPAALALLAALGVLPTALAYTLYFRGLRRAAPATGAMAALLEPLVGTVLAALLLGERLGATGIAGAVLVGAAVVLASLPQGSTAVEAGARAAPGQRRVAGQERARSA